MFLAFFIDLQFINRMRRRFNLGMKSEIELNLQQLLSAKAQHLFRLRGIVARSTGFSALRPDCASGRYFAASSTYP
jgi:hypothetical protein